MKVVGSGVADSNERYVVGGNELDFRFQSHFGALSWDTAHWGWLSI